MARRFFHASGSALAIALVLGSLSGGSARGDDEPGGTPECISHRGEARYRAFGYDHVVIIESTCETAAHCTVSTDVTPDEHEVDVAAGATAEVLTRRGSPASAFTPRVACTLR